MGSDPQNDSSPDPMIGRQLGSYRIVRKIAQGGMGAVYDAAHVESSQRAAVKVLLPELTSNQEAANRFFNEAQAIRSISHPGLVQIYEHGTSSDGGEAYIVMEFIEGESLREHLESHYIGGHALPIMIQLAEVLDVTHQHRIIHRERNREKSSTRTRKKSALRNRCGPALRVLHGACGKAAIDRVWMGAVRPSINGR